MIDLLGDWTQKSRPEDCFNRSFQSRKSSGGGVCSVSKMDKTPTKGFMYNMDTGRKRERNWSNISDNNGSYIPQMSIRH